MCSLVALLNEDEPLLIRPLKERERAEEAHKRFLGATGDHIMFLNIYEEYRMCMDKEKDRWCERNFVNGRMIKRVHRSRSQLVSLLNRLDVKLVALDSRSPHREAVILKALLSGLFMQVAMVKLDGRCMLLQTQHEPEIHKQSYVDMGAARWVVYSDYVFAKEEVLRTVSMIEAGWLFIVAPSYFVPEMFADSEIKFALFKAKRGVGN
jgi:pre-mRNA-splicing factor ATP-dependent RNA helicase DHX15/PRP43